MDTEFCITCRGDDFVEFKSEGDLVCRVSNFHVGAGPWRCELPLLRFKGLRISHTGISRVSRLLVAEMRDGEGVAPHR